MANGNAHFFAKIGAYAKGLYFEQVAPGGRVFVHVLQKIAMMWRQI